MKATCLMENAACQPGLQFAHGLSTLIEANGEAFLLDMGPDAAFADNARALGIDLDAVTCGAVSHGHYDHGGGLPRFFELNSHAPVHLRRSAFEPYFSDEEPIGLAPELAHHAQIRTHDGEAACEVAPGFTLFSATGEDPLPSPANACLRDAAGLDAFDHEQSLLVEEPATGDGPDAAPTLWLFGGCAHRGIVTILERSRQIAGRYPDVVVSGFHLALGGKGRCAVDDAYLDELAERLLATGATFYTCHCTGDEAFNRLKERMGEALQPFHAGTVITA